MAATMALTAGASFPSRAALAANGAQPPRLTRAESFFGLHFDFHAGRDCTEIGKHTTRAMIENLLDQVRPDYVQTDCKGHPGLSSYPTKVGNQAPGFVGDPLRLWRQVTAEHGVALYMHYSGVWDSEAVRLHPDWAVVNADGKRDSRATSFFSPYADRLLIPQLRELAGDYGVDGAWVDGECWASRPDYGEPALAAFRRETGIATVPRKPSDPHWHAFLDFNRELFRRYLRHYIAAVKTTNPEFQLCSNWAFTDHMAEPVCAAVNFLSGDYSPDDSLNSARLSARYLANQGMPWDLMAWSFSRKVRSQGGPPQKTAVQLQREAAVVLALGGGFQAYFKQKRDGSIYDEQVPVMAELAKFCRARQAVCHHAKSVPQVALVLSRAGHYRRINGLFSRDLGHVSGVLQALLESQYSVDVVGEHHLAGRMADYPLIVVPEWAYLEPRFIEDLLAYAKSGGSLLLIGPRTAAMFVEALDVELKGEPQAATHYLEHDGRLIPTQGLVQRVGLGKQAVAVGRLHAAADRQSPAQPAASITHFGRGLIAATYCELGHNYRTTRDADLRAFVAGLVKQLFPRPMVEVAGSPFVDVTLARNHGKLLVNLVNTAGPHQSAGILESIPPVGPLEVTLRLPKRPAKMTLEPDGEALTFGYADGRARVAIPKLAIHDILVVEE